MAMYKIDEEGVEFINGVARNKEHPLTFEIPDKATRESIPVGSYAKIGLTKAGGKGERFWVKIEVRYTSGRYLVRVANDLQFFDYPCGEPLVISPDHVLGVLD